MIPNIDPLSSIDEGNKRSSDAGLIATGVFVADALTFGIVSALLAIIDPQRIRERRLYRVVSGGTVSGGTVSGGTVSGGTVSGGTVSGSRVTERSSRKPQGASNRHESERLPVERDQQALLRAFIWSVWALVGSWWSLQ